MITPIQLLVFALFGFGYPTLYIAYDFDSLASLRKWLPAGATYVQSICRWSLDRLYAGDYAADPEGGYDMLAAYTAENYYIVFNGNDARLVERQPVPA